MTRIRTAKPRTIGYKGLRRPRTHQKMAELLMQGGAIKRSDRGTLVFMGRTATDPRVLENVAAANASARLQYTRTF